MKVVLFCGGFGMRLRDYAENVPKPLVPIGTRPILWHVMKYYAHFGHTDFILALGWRADAIKNYFLNYYAEPPVHPSRTNGEPRPSGSRAIPLALDHCITNSADTDVPDWNITFVDTGTQANVGQRLMAVREHLKNEEVFLANYADGLSDLHLPHLIKEFEKRDSTAAFLAVHPQQSWHVVSMDGEGIVNKVQPISDCNTWMNGGFFVLRNDIFEYMEEGDELVMQPFQRLIDRRQLFGLKYNGFWSCMDTFKDKQSFEDMIARGITPWEVWNNGSVAPESEPTPPVAEPA
jgi:glucose-1-phosphate cytidylyltransferase